MKFAHIADCHIGSWRDPKLRDISTTAFVKAIDRCKEKKVDFVLIAGDLFNTSLPSVDRLKIVVQKFKELNDINIPIYTIAGSHDFSPSGKTMLDVLESAGLCVNVTKGRVEGNKLFLNFTVDEKTGTKITGMI
jgi:DNA repair exonuclease SbcCD nuclease subunit